VPFELPNFANYSAANTIHKTASEAERVKYVFCLHETKSLVMAGAIEVSNAFWKGTTVNTFSLSGNL
jgi:hypothetical protein